MHVFGSQPPPATASSSSSESSPPSEPPGEALGSTRKTVSARLLDGHNPDLVREPGTECLLHRRLGVLEQPPPEILVLQAPLHDPALQGPAARPRPPSSRLPLYVSPGPAARKALYVACGRNISRASSRAQSVAGSRAEVGGGPSSEAPRCPSAVGSQPQAGSPATGGNLGPGAACRRPTRGRGRRARPPLRPARKGESPGRRCRPSPRPPGP